jgi:hypothetical protein
MGSARNSTSRVVLGLRSRYTPARLTHDKSQVPKLVAWVSCLDQSYWAAEPVQSQPTNNSAPIVPGVTRQRLHTELSSRISGGGGRDAYDHLINQISSPSPTAIAVIAISRVRELLLRRLKRRRPVVFLRYHVVIQTYIYLSNPGVPAKVPLTTYNWFLIK